MKIPSKKLFIKIVVAFFAITFILFLSEYLYTATNHPETIEKYRENLRRENLERSYLSWIIKNEPQTFIGKVLYVRVTTKILYDYFSYVEDHPIDETCKPICLSFQDSQKYLGLFRKLKESDGVSFLNTGQRSDLYFWMATISIWDSNHDETTIEYLNDSIQARGSNNDVAAFLIDLQKIVREPVDQTDIIYFTEKLKEDTRMHTYQRILYAKAAEKIALTDSQDNDTQIIYLEKSNLLNPWNQQYYVELSKVYLSAGKNNNAKEILQRCVSQLKSDSSDCAKMLDSAI